MTDHTEHADHTAEPSSYASDDSEQTSDSLAGDLINVTRGFCMGVADTVPGVSGGTVALILGHYDRLIAAISHVDLEALSLLRQRNWSGLSNKLDLRFLIALAIGIGAGIVLLAGLMHWLLAHRVNETMAVFFGMVLASVWVVRRNVTNWSPMTCLAVIVGAGVALAITQIPGSTAELSLGYLFFTASIAICAMILPGISGAFILLLLGVYEPVIGMIKQFASGDISGGLILRLTVFASGCLFGLLAFSRLLNYLLNHHRNTTMATLIGLMLGSIGRLWPLQVVTPETAGLKLKYQVFEFVSPAQYPGSVIVLVLLSIVSAAVVLFADHHAAKLNRPAA